MKRHLVFVLLGAERRVIRTSSKGLTWSCGIFPTGTKEVPGIGGSIPEFPQSVVKSRVKLASPNSRSRVGPVGSWNSNDVQ